MPRKTKSTATKTAAKAAAPKAAAKTATKATATKVTKAATKAAAAPKPVAAKPVEAKPVETKPVEGAPEPPTCPLSAELVAEFAAFHTQLQQLQSGFSSLRASARAIEKKATRELRAAQKAASRRKRRTATRAPSGFVKPTLISNELASFLGKDQGTQMARTEVTREINAYIRANNLQDKDNGRKINADTKLKQLLKLGKSDELTYFNLQKFMSPHFAKASAATTGQ